MALRLAFSLAMLLSISSTAPCVAFAGTGTELTAPHPTVKTICGVGLAVDTHWVEGPGYRPVRVTATTLIPSSVDREITIQFHADHNYVSRKKQGATVRQFFVLPAGAPSATTVLSVPQFTNWHSLAWNVWVDDHFAKELSVEHVPGPSQSTVWDMRGYRTLIIDPKTTSRSSAAIPPPPKPGSNQFATALQAISMVMNISGALEPLVVECAPKDLPTRWRHYSSLDNIYVGLDDLRSVATDVPDAWKAIQHWVEAGGNLTVTGMGSDWDRIGDVEKLFDLPQEPAGKPTDRGWTVGPQLLTFPLDDYQLRQVYEQDDAIEISDDSVTGGTKATAKELSVQFLWRRQAIGSLTLVHTDDEPALRDFVGLPWNVSEAAPQSWSDRHGVDLSNGNLDFWNFLIPGIGLAPVTEFQILITLFVIVIGPVNYFLLRRWRRIHWLIVTVPASAAVITLALFGYALLSDGLGTRVRVRSFTEIDQRHGRAVCWSRQSYYAGLAPSALIMPSDVVVVPMRPRSDYSYRNFSGGGVLGWELFEIDADESQELRGGWLHSRTPMQLMTIRARDVPHRLRVLPNEGQVAVKNELGTHIEQLLVRDAEGDFYVGEAISVDTESDLEATTLAEARIRFKKYFARNAPRFPDDASGNGQVFGLRGSWNSNAYNDGALDAGRLEWAMRTYGPIGFATCPRKSYLAIVTRSPEVALGVEDASEESSYHVIFGHW